ncbi:MAG: hypothetical protein L3J84_02805 [Gammaproteobacteria bacterium]|nr:hypothetical protein [Gammaproteobacteria bacterium]
MMQRSTIQCRVGHFFAKSFAGKTVTRKNIINRDLIKADNGIHISTVLILAILILFPAFAQAALKNVAISTDINLPIVINLSQSISNISEPIVTIPVQPNSGIATVVECTDGTQVCVEYQPAVNFQGQESFNYAVENDEGIQKQQ